MAGSLLPVVATVYLFGCCVLPFHALLHGLVPMCGMATRAVHTESRDAREEPAVPVSREARGANVWAPMRLPARAPMLVAGTIAIVQAASPDFLRSFVTLGALRCDDDIGLHALFALFRI